MWLSSSAVACESCVWNGGVSTRDLSAAIGKTPLYVTFIEDASEPLTLEIFVAIVRELNCDPIEVMAEILRERKKGN